MKPDQICKECHHAPSCRLRPEHAGASCYCPCHDAADAGPWWAGVDWQQLREQKLTLVQLAMTAEAGNDAKTSAHLGGIVNLLDALMDQAAEVLGERTVFGDLNMEG